MEIRELGPGSVATMRELLAVFSDAFDEPETYSVKPPSDQYLQKLLASDTFLVLVAVRSGEVVGGLTAYELLKYEQARSEIYIYDLAVVAVHRRQGIATQLIDRLREIAGVRGAYTLFVQADTGIEDQPAINLYSKLGTREEVLHFDIAVQSVRKSRV